jgi:hypothetical protein
MKCYSTLTHLCVLIVRYSLDLAIPSAKHTVQIFFENFLCGSACMFTPVYLMHVTFMLVLNEVASSVYVLLYVDTASVETSLAVFRSAHFIARL